jgi:hypothetical protein
MYRMNAFSILKENKHIKDKKCCPERRDGDG